MSRSVQGTFQFWNAVDELAEAQKRASLASGICCNPGDGRSSSHGEFSSQSTVTSVKTHNNWRRKTAAAASSSDEQPQLGFERSRAEASPTSVDRSSSSAFFLPPSSLQQQQHHQDMAAHYLSSSSHSHNTDPSLQTLYLMDPAHHNGSFAHTPNSLLLQTPVAEFASYGPHTIARFPNSASSSPCSSSSPSMAMFHHPPQVVSMPTDVYSTIPRQSNGHLYNWAAANGALQFHGSEDNQSIMDPVKLSAPPEYGGRAFVSQQFQEHAPFLSASAHGITMDMDGLQASAAGAGQILSLSLSPQQQAPVTNSIQQPLQQQSYSMQQQQQQQPDAGFFHGGDSQYKAGILSDKPFGGPTSNAFTDNFLSAGGYPSQIPSGQINFAMGARASSKYLRPAQELLNEIVGVGLPIKTSSSKLSQSQPWISATSASEGPAVVRDKFASDIPADKLMMETKKEVESVVAGGAPLNATAATSEQRTESNNVELSSAQRQDIQEKRAKLIAMRDEVDRRYRQYYHQMQSVITSFESAAGIGAATTYTSLALQTISKHFRCLRDAITGQIQLTCKALGDEEASGFVKGETSKLRLIGQQLRQQRVLRQLGMMQQQAWRPQRGLPEHSVSILRAWLFEHFLHPYPKDADKVLLARQTGLSRSQVSNWFINARVRLWKPMVEEMYLEEIKEAEGDGGDRSGGEDAEVSQDVTDAERSKPAKQAKVSDETLEGLHGRGYPSDALHGTGSPVSNILFSEESIRQGVIKAKNVLQSASSLVPPAVNAAGLNVDDALQQEMKMRTEGNYREPYGIPQNNGFVQADHLNLPAYASYPINNLNRYSQESFPGTYSANGGISLTLGLQHFEGSSFSGSYGQVQSHAPTVRHEEGGNVPIGYYGTMNDNSFEALGLQNRKPFAAHMLRHDFVV